MQDVKKTVRDEYGKIGASGRQAGGCCSGEGGCTTTCPDDGSAKLGYSPEELADLPDGADLGLGCGNPQAIAGLQPGETVVDLGSGGGIDCFLAAGRVGESGHVIGVDMTPEMVDRARASAAKSGIGNVEFRLGEIEHLPVADGTVDAIMSNCVINLSPEKPAVFREAFRVLKPGGRLAITDIVATAPLPDEVRDDLRLHVGCVAGAATIDDLESALEGAGFENVRIEPLEGSRTAIRELAPETGIDAYVVSATIEATRP